MPFGLGERLRKIARKAAVFAAFGLLAVLGLIWLTAALVAALGRFLTADAAMAIVGVLLCLPLAVMLMRSGGRKDKSDKHAMASETAYEHRLAASLPSLAGRLMQDRPKVALAVMVAAGILAARMPRLAATLTQTISDGLAAYENAKAAQSA